MTQNSEGDSNHATNEVAPQEEDVKITSSTQENADQEVTADSSTTPDQDTTTQDNSDSQQSTLPHQSPSNPINHKTPCKFYQQIGTCKYGFNCRYSHGFPQGPLHLNGNGFGRHKITGETRSQMRNDTWGGAQQQRSHSRSAAHHRDSPTNGHASSGAGLHLKPKKNIMQRLRNLLMAHAYQSLRRPINPEDKQDIATHRITKAPDLVNMMFLLEPDVWKKMIQICENTKTRSEVESKIREAVQRAEALQQDKSSTKRSKRYVRNLEPGLSFDEEGKVQMIIQVQVDHDEHVNLVPTTVGDFPALGFVKVADMSSSSSGRREYDQKSPAAVNGTDAQRGPRSYVSSRFRNQFSDRSRHDQQRYHGEQQAYVDPRTQSAPYYAQQTYVYAQPHQGVEDWTNGAYIVQQMPQQQEDPSQPKRPNYADVVAGLASPTD